MNFSIVIPLYNKRETLKRAIESALYQTLVPLEVVVVDDGSSDGSPDIVAQFGPKVRLVTQANAGPAAARNNGARLCSGDQLIFLDGDDELASSALEEHAACIAGHSDVDLSLASCRRIEPDGTTTEVSLARRVDSGTSPFAYLANFSPACVLNVPASGICVSRALFVRVGGWDEFLRCWEVTDFLMRACMCARVVGVHREVSLMVYELPQNSQFVRTRAVPEYRMRLASKMTACLAEMAEPARTEMANHALGFAYSLWHDGYLREYKLVCSRLASFLDPEHREERLYRISRLPESVLKPLYLMRKVWLGLGWGS